MACKIDIRKGAEIAGFTVGWMAKKDAQRRAVWANYDRSQLTKKQEAEDVEKCYQAYLEWKKKEQTP